MNKQNYDSDDDETVTPKRPRTRLAVKFIDDGNELL